MIIRVREAKENILESVNSAIRGGVPAYVLEPVIAEIHASVSKAAQAEYERALKIQEAQAAQEAQAEEQKNDQPPEAAGGGNDGT